MKPTRILLTRHGQTVTNREGRFCGHSETPLTDLGFQQACALSRRLHATPIHAAYTSDFSRAVRTAAIVLDERNVVPRIDPALREIHYGEWELLKERSVARTAAWREEFAKMRAEDPAWRPPGGETIHDVRVRTIAALERIAASHRGNTGCRHARYSHELGSPLCWACRNTPPHSVDICLRNVRAANGLSHHLNDTALAGVGPAQILMATAPDTHVLRVTTSSSQRPGRIHLSQSQPARKPHPSGGRVPGPDEQRLLRLPERPY
jgi:broad specificity phosphatase PhoE